MTECIHGQEFESCSFGCTLKKEELAIRAVTVFKDLFPEAWEHNVKERPGAGLNTGKDIEWCTKCGLIAGQLEKLDCTNPTIDINDWNVAMKLFRKATEGMFAEEVAKLLGAKRRYNLDTLGALVDKLRRATPADYILAAIQTREKENG